MAVKDIILTSIESITVFDVNTGAYRFTLEELQNATIANGEEKTDITGKNGRKISSLKKNKTVTISGTNGLLSGGLLELQTGGEFENKASNVMWTDYLKVTVATSSATANTTYKATGSAGSEIKALYKKNADGTIGEKLEQATTASTGKFAYNPGTKTLTFNSTDFTNGEEIVVYYDRKITSDVLKNESDKFSGKATLYIDALGEDKCDNIYRVQIYVPRADFNGEFSIEIGGDPTVHAFEAESLVGACGAGTDLWTYTVFGANAADAS